jgi:hypothetical protein
MPEGAGRRRAIRLSDGPGIVLIMLAMVALPAAWTLHQVRRPGTLVIPPGSNPTPYGYTWSLLLFIVPILVILFWLLPQENLRLPKRAFWHTIAILFPMGCALDFFFAHKFFTFPNSQATLGIGAPALGGPVPVEEYVFYFTGFIAILLIYIWLGEFWLAAYNLNDYAGESKKVARLLQFHPTSAVLGALLIVAAIIYKKMLSPDPAGFPGYFVVLVTGGLVPAVGFFPSVRSLINWRAFSLTLFYVLLVSLLWEATLALPYGWWGYQPESMVGISVGAWTNMPVEAASVWIAVAYGTTIVFEVVKLWRASEKTAREAFIGVKSRREETQRALGRK